MSCFCARRKPQNGQNNSNGNKLKAKNRTPGAILPVDRSSRDLAEQQNPKDSQHIAEQDRQLAQPSFSTLQEEYKLYNLQDSGDKRDQDIAAYVQALEFNHESAFKRVKSLEIDRGSVLERFQSLRSTVKSVIKEKDPRASAEDWENVSAYLGRTLDQVHEQCEVIKKKDREIRKLNGQIQKQTEIHESQIELQRITYEKEHKELEERYNAELSRRETTHKLTVSRLEEAHKAMIARLDDSIATLQSEVLTPGTRFQPLTDSECKGRLGLIRTRVYSLTRSSIISDGRAYGELFDQTEFVRSTEGKEYMYVVDASIWKVLFDGIFSSPFRVFGQHGEIFTSSWGQLFGTGGNSRHIDSWPVPNSRSEEWRYGTAEVLRKELDKDRRFSLANKVKESYETNSKAVMDDIASILAKLSVEDKTREIQEIVDNSCSLALDFSIQRCRIQLYVPKENEIIILGSNSCDFIDLKKSNKDTLGGMVQLVVKPGLRKSGDGRGESLDTIITLLASEVFLDAPKN